jgi:hypothetical protein
LEGRRQLRITQAQLTVRVDLINIEGMDWINLAKDTDWRRALMNTIMNLGFLQKKGTTLLSEGTISLRSTLLNELEVGAVFR